ncbi:UPF0223 family protein [Enterococcus asini]|uniref:UPF0223 family protein n=1 Tax=Enterococcus asini TaxID=57732 RepID=UPI00138718D8|nr:UPF0223 family protein [Enterococcus asini]MDT2762986.1 UPF0223 family protein [Enterococcus asini]
MQEYQYPLDLDWSTSEMVVVMKMWEVLEAANEEGVQVADFLQAYQKFKQVVPAIGEERRLGRDFEKSSGYSLYHTVKAVKEQGTGRFKMSGETKKGRKK